MRKSRVKFLPCLKITMVKQDDILTYDIVTGVQCERCDSRNATKHRQNTSYVDDEFNFVTLCPICKEDNDEYWQERWDEYNSGRL